MLLLVTHLCSVRHTLVAEPQVVVSVVASEACRTGGEVVCAVGASVAHVGGAPDTVQLVV